MLSYLSAGMRRQELWGSATDTVASVLEATEFYVSEVILSPLHPTCYPLRQKNSTIKNLINLTGVLKCTGLVVPQKCLQPRREVLPVLKRQSVIESHITFIFYLRKAMAALNETVIT